METVFEPDNNIEGHMIVNLLERSEIKAELIGQHLQGGVGELPAAGNIRVVVFDSGQVEEARRIIKEWEKTPHADESVTPQSRSSGLPSFFLGILVGAGVASAFIFWLFNPPMDSQRVDYDDDGIIDEYVYWKGDFVDQVDGDRNGDGEIDVSYHYGFRSGVENSEFDDDFDGVFEGQVQYERGISHSMSVDVSGNGVTDHRFYYVNGVVDRVEILNPRTGLIRKTETYKAGWLEDAQWDTDADGVLDTFIKYDLFGEELSRSSLTGEEYQSR